MAGRCSAILPSLSTLGKLQQVQLSTANWRTTNLNGFPSGEITGTRCTGDKPRDRVFGRLVRRFPHLIQDVRA